MWSRLWQLLMPDPNCTARLVYRPEYEAYDFGPEHPLQPVRIRASLDLLASLDLSPSHDQQLRPPPASVEELQLVHSAKYIDRSRAWMRSPMIRYSRTKPVAGALDLATRRRSSASTAAALVAGGTLRAVRGVLAGSSQHAFNPAGGLHHALREPASGVCIYNDAAVAIASTLREREARVLYLDFDAHHSVLR